MAEGGERAHGAAAGVCSSPCPDPYVLALALAGGVMAG